MSRECFVPREFRADTLAVIEQANEIIDEYQDKGFTLTLRQLYYQFVTRGKIENKFTEYKRLGSIINDARLAGLIDWAAMEDRVRNLDVLPNWSDPQDFCSDAVDWYREDLWKTQPVNVEVWIEKDALAGVIKPVCHRWRLPALACRGYVSQSELYSAGQRFLSDAMRNRRRTLVLHLGDHDPSGIDMTRDNLERLRMFTDTGIGSIIDVKRLALNFDQVEQYDPPANPAKDTDSRATGYVEKYGKESWELDALDPEVIDKLIDDAVREVIDMRTWKKALKHEEQERARFKRIPDNWDAVDAFLNDIE
jgi:hypothetical protein